MRIPFAEKTVPLPIRPLVKIQPIKAINNAWSFTGVIFSLNNGAAINTTKNGAVARRIAESDREFITVDMLKNKFNAIELEMPAPIKTQRSLILIFRSFLSYILIPMSVITKAIIILTNTIVSGL